MCSMFLIALCRMMEYEHTPLISIATINYVHWLK